MKRVGRWTWMLLTLLLLLLWGRGVFLKRAESL